MSIFGKKQPKHPLEPVPTPIWLNGRPADAVKAGDDANPSRPADMPGGYRSPRAFAPHCDARILHAPGECWACDLYPDWQDLRVKWGICFTGQVPDPRVVGEARLIERHMLPCPADYNRPPDSPSDHRQWGPNQAQGSHRG